jgi:hypothetical protein
MLFSSLKFSSVTLSRFTTAKRREIMAIFYLRRKSVDGECCKGMLIAVEFLYNAEPRFMVPSGLIGNVRFLGH